MMNRKIIPYLVTVITLTSAVISTSYSVVQADSGKDYCYAQIGDGYIGFETKNKCNQGQQRDDTPESHSYKEDP